MALLTPDVQYPEPETAPLLQNVSHPDDTPAPNEEPTYLERVAAIVQEPLSPLTQLLLVATLVFLLLSSVFIGLFAGAQHKLNSGGNGAVTTTIVVTSTSVATTTQHATTTSVSTTTVSIPAPAPTSPPEEVCEPCILLTTSIH